MRRKFYLLFIVLIFLLGTCNKKNVWNNDLKITLIREIGVEIAKTTGEEPYQFSVIHSIDCNNEGNIYVLEGKEGCVKVFDKNGKFLKKLFREGRGPQEIINAYEIVINKFTGNLFVLQEYGYQLKEFDPLGKYIELYPLPEQIRYYFDFIDQKRILYISGGRSRENIYNNFKIINIETRKIEKEFASVKRESIMNATMRFIVTNGTLWTCPGDEMRLVAYDLNSEKKKKLIEIREKYKKSKILRGPNWIRLVFYNYAKPMLIDNKVHVLLAKFEYFKDDTLEAVHTPKSQRFFIYLFDKGNLKFKKELKEIAEEELIKLGTVWKNRLIFYRQEPYPIIKILEIKEN